LLSTFFTTPESSLLELAIVPVWLDALWLVDDLSDGLAVDDDLSDGLVVADDWLDELCAAAVVTPTNPATATPINNVFMISPPSDRRRYEMR
jgi:hypothetical protein